MRCVYCSHCEINVIYTIVLNVHTYLCRHTRVPISIITHIHNCREEKKCSRTNTLLEIVQTFGEIKGHKYSAHNVWHFGQHTANEHFISVKLVQEGTDIDLHECLQQVAVTLCTVTEESYRKFKVSWYLCELSRQKSIVQRKKFRLWIKN